MDQSNSAEDVQQTETCESGDLFIELKENLQLLLDNQQFSDVTLVSKQGKYKVKAHKNILASVSKYFKAMFGGSFRESAKREVILSQIDGDALKPIVNFIYTGRIVLSVDSVQSVLEGAHLLELSSLEKLCCAFMKKNIDVSNCLAIASIAKLYNYCELHDAAMLCLCENFEAVSKEKAFRVLRCDQLYDLISSDDLRVPSEVNVLSIIMKWINYDQDHRQKFTEKLLGCVRFLLLPPRYISQFIDKVESAEMLRSVCDTLVHHGDPNMHPTNSYLKQTKIRNFKDVIVAISGCGKSDRSYLRVGIQYKNVPDWIYIKWPALPRPRTNMKYALIGKTLVVAGGIVQGEDSIDYLNLETLQWTTFPSAILSETNALITLNNALYAICNNGLRKLEDPLINKWSSVQVSNISTLNSTEVWATHKNLIYFPCGGYFGSYNIDEDTFNMQEIRRVSAGHIICMQNIRYEDSDYLVEISKSQVSATSYDITTYNLNTCKSTRKTRWSNDRLLDNMRTELHGDSIILYKGKRVERLKVFQARVGAFVPLMIDVDILLTDNKGIC